ncbi:MAG: hypothetical protein JNM68_15315 [Dinghuibacter sp.]|nr:hypothetical protein [Dinghuibacter sp.]
MELKKGMMLLSESGSYNHITINSGVQPFAQQEKTKVEYAGHSFYPSFEEKAFVPKRDWRSLNVKEISALRPTERRTDTNTVYTGELPGKLKEKLAKMELWRSTSRAEVFERFKQDPETTTAVNKYMEEFLNAKANGKPHRIHYLGTNLPNLETVACDTTVMPKDHREEDKKYMGIHNDGTYYVPFRTINKSGNRLTINLGLETRYFLFVNLTMSQAYNMIRRHYDVADHKIDVINISKYFFSCFPGYPVLRIEQKPYQYYIAPTDNCFHDGSTLGAKELDIVLVYFGSFRF